MRDLHELQQTTFCEPNGTQRGADTAMLEPLSTRRTDASGLNSSGYRALLIFVISSGRA